MQANQCEHLELRRKKAISEVLQIKHGKHIFERAEKVYQDVPSHDQVYHNQDTQTDKKPSPEAHAQTQNSQGSLVEPRERVLSARKG